ncbi:MAG: hypothetical protein IKI57_05150 [Clostridia bacterium]|nr:hypothetical protein [Clostridia bacterium]
MTNEKGISMISLIVTILLIIILAAITAPILSSVINDSMEADAKLELSNVQSVVENAKSLIMTDQFIPNEEEYKISDADLESKFGPVLTPEEIEHIENINGNPDIQAPFKYYLMNQAAFDDEFGNNFNVKGIRENREYLVNYWDGLILVNYNGSKITNKTDDPIIPTPDLVRGKVDIKFVPNGNSEWARQQAAALTFVIGEETEIREIRYMWSEEINEPSESAFVGETISTSEAMDGVTINLAPLQDKTGNGWFLWVLVKYTDVGVERTKMFRSNAFFIDNTAPTATFSVDEIVR